MTDERNIAHDKKVANDKGDQGDSSNDAVQAQPGRKTPQVDGDTDPSNSRAREMYKDGGAPRDHSHDSSEHPAEASESADSDVA
jgi:hypothetical protein